ncbi:hypothetical protein [Haloferula sp.]
MKKWIIDPKMAGTPASEYELLAGWFNPTKSAKLRSIRLAPVAE